MTEIEEIRSTLNNMKSHFRSGFSSMEQEYLEALHLRLFNKPLQKRAGCQDCFRDAYICISNKLNSLTEMPKQSPYILKAGIVASSFGSSEFFVLEMPEEKAENWLHEFPERIKLFQAYPEDWEARISARFAPGSTIDIKDDQSAIQTAMIEGAQKKGRKKANQ